MKHSYDIIVVGGGHAGCEAALAGARMGASVLMVTMDPLKIGVMSCNPCVGGVGKGQLVKEIDALGGEMGVNADYTGIQFRRLNTRKGSAVQSSRCQSDKKLYAARMQEVVGAQEGLDVLSAEVKALLVENAEIKGVSVAINGELSEILAPAVVITSGTFMKAVMHCGESRTEGGRVGEKGAVGLSDHLSELGFPLLRLKTGTPPRLKSSSLNTESLQRQAGDVPPRRFSFGKTKITLPQIDCHLTFTNEQTHKVIAANLAASPLYSGKIKGIGPRYCPSIEDKVVKFPEKPRHQVFLEPEGLDTDWIYPNGISTSLPESVQEAFVRTIPGCEEAEFIRYGYAVEYDCIDARFLAHNLEARGTKGLFLAGQVNGTSGYEEAAAQGLVAGVNAALLVQGRPAMILSRTNSYIGVMVDDLVTKGVTEPYRMFTSRSEYRLSIREDNADLRLRDIGRDIGLISAETYLEFEEKRRQLSESRLKLEKFHVKHSKRVEALMAEHNTPMFREPESLYKLLKRPELDLISVVNLAGEDFSWELSPEVSETLEIDVKYEGYIKIQDEERARVERFSSIRIPQGFKYGDVSGLSYEVREKLSKAQPGTLEEAGRISGVTPAALAAVLAFLKRSTKVEKLRGTN